MPDALASPDHGTAYEGAGDEDILIPISSDFRSTYLLLATASFARAGT
jgi:4-hydroxy-L-threonine phosphate dehydrogenase PdxA